MTNNVRLIALSAKVSMGIASVMLISQTLVASPGHTRHLPDKPTPFTASNKVADIVVKGKVLNAEGPMGGVTVQVRGSSKAVTTNDNGEYTITAPEDGTLVFSYAGYTEQRVAVDKKTEINITLKSDASLEDVVVVGYRTQTRGALTGSITSVKGSDFQNQTSDNLSNALAGRLTGANIIQAAGTPGMESSIRIRGFATRSNNAPLFVIDGVVSDKVAFDGLAPNDVESVTILKDGASAAIYGSRASGGVVLVTTRRGKDGPARINYNGMYSIQKPTRIPETLNAFDHASQINHWLKYIKTPNVENDARYYTQDELDYFRKNSWNWIDEIMVDPTTTQHSLDVSGGNKGMKYFLGGSYNGATGAYNNVDFEKFTVRGNMDVTVSKNLKVSLDMNTDTRRTNGPSWDVNNWRLEDLYKALLFRPAMVPPYVNGQPVGNSVEWHPGVALNPDVAGYNKRKWVGLNYTATANYTIPGIKGLTAKISFNKFTREIHTKQYNVPYDMYLFEGLGGHGHIVGEKVVGTRARATPEFLYDRTDRTNRYQFNAQLNYKRTFGKHGLDVIGVYEQSEDLQSVTWAQKNDFISNKIDQWIGGSSTTNTAGGYEQDFGRLSYVGIVSYNYDQKYMVEASFRYDGSTIFPPNKRWGFFPSASLGWKVSDENFFKNVKFVNDLKVRVGVGLLGNDSVGIFQYVQAYRIVPGAVFDKESVGLEGNIPANPNITWEKALNYNVGIDSRFYDSRIGLKVDLYYRKTYDMLLPRDQGLPTSLGTALPDENYGKMDSKGIEIELDYTSQASGKNSINWYARGNFGYATNKVLVWNEPVGRRDFEKQTGKPLGYMIGYEAIGILRTQKDLDALPVGYSILGVTPQLGMLNYRDVRGPNGEAPDGRITTDDRVLLSDYSVGNNNNNSSHPISFGLSLGANWKSLSLDVLIQGLAGARTMLPTTGRDIQARPEESSFSYWADSWSPENPNGKMPGYRVTNTYRTRFDESSFFVVDNSFVRLKNVTLSYGLPQSMISKASLRSVRVYFTGTNMLMLYTKNNLYDPEMNNITSYPMMASYTFGLNIGL